MNLNDLIQDPRISITAESKNYVNSRAIQKELKGLSRYKFWDAPPNQQGLWEHQMAAIATVVTYLYGDKVIPERQEHKEAALLKMPTGTGKSGVIAVLARCLPNIRRVLILTPRTALVEQLLKDISYRFWSHIGYESEPNEIYIGNAAQIGAELQYVHIKQLLPRNINSLTELFHHGTERIILVGTHQALGAIRKIALDPIDINVAQYQSFLQNISETFDLIIVDEGHYEPAISWSQGVRELNLPTVLLSATPYRNDYKSFRVRGRYVFNFPYKEAVENRIIRPAEIIITKNTCSIERRNAIAQFVQILKEELPSRLQQTTRWFSGNNTIPKVMVRADDLDTLEQLQIAIDSEFDTKSILIHDRAKKTNKNKNRFINVASAIRENGEAQFWIHQNKLMEGIDDPSFVAVAIFDLMGNARQLVQQIGRVTRYSKGDRRIKQTGWVISFNTNAYRIQTTWERYQRYEEYISNNVSNIVANEVTLPDRLLRYMAEYQYINGEFRNRLEVDSPLKAKDIQLPLSAIVLKYSKPLSNIRDYTNIIEEAIMDKDRYKITPIDDMPSGSIGFSYYAWCSSPYLIDQFFPEWQLGIFIAVQKNDLIFMHDTTGIVVDLVKLNLERVDKSIMEKGFPERNDGNSARLSRMSFSSLDMSQGTIRGMALRTRSFNDVFTDLLDPMLVPSSAAGFINGNARYIGFRRSRIRDSSDRYESLEDYVKWTATIADELRNPEQIRSDVFGRYANIVENIDIDGAQPISILLDPSQDAFIDMLEEDTDTASISSRGDINYEDLCADIDPITGEFVIKINNIKVTCSIKYKAKLSRYHLSSEELNNLFPVRERRDRKQGQSLVQRLNHAQAFRIIVKKNGVIYSEGKFYKPRFLWVTNDGKKPVLDYIYTSPSLEKVDSEKGENLFGQNNDLWKEKSIFGLFAAACDNNLKEPKIMEDELTKGIDDYQIWLCDDDSQETADFIGINNESKKITFVHAKIGAQGARGTGFNIDGLQAVGRQVLASLAFIGKSEPSTVWTPERWESDVQANTITLIGKNRIFKNSNNLTAHDINATLISACHNSAFNKEVWIVGACMTRRKDLEDGLDDNPELKNRLKQFLMHWDALQTACARANVRLKFFCS